MDEVITCRCGCQAWYIGTSGTRCCKCGFWLERGAVLADVTKVNNAITPKPYVHRPRRKK